MARKTPFYITSEECDVPLKQKPEIPQQCQDGSNSSIYGSTVSPSRQLLSRQQSVVDERRGEVVGGEVVEEEDSLYPPPPRLFLATPNVNILLPSPELLPTPERGLPRKSSTEEPPTIPSSSLLGFSFSREYWLRNMMRSASLPSHLHDFHDCGEVMGTLGAHYHTSGSTTMTASSGSSRLAMMQARIQQQLMHEKESRLLQMAARQEAEREGTIQRVTKSNASTLSSSLSSISSLNSSMGGQGRVRKLFQERRTNGYGHSPVGRDKSYPLEPVRGGGVPGGRPPVKPVKGVVKQRGVSVDRGRTNYDHEAMLRSRSNAGFLNNNANAFNNNYEVRSPARTLRPPQSKSLSHHKSTSSLLDANQNYNGRGSSSSSGVYSRGPSRDPSPAPSPSPSNRFGFRGPPSRGPSPSPHPVSESPARVPNHRRTSLASRYSEDRLDAPRSQSQPRQPPVPPPRQQLRQPPRQQERPTRPPRRQPSPPPDEDDSAFFEPKPPPRSQSKPRSTKGVPPITRVRSVTSPQPPKKPNPPPKPKAAPAPAPARPSKPPPGMVSCKMCGRHFNSDRIEKHQAICTKAAAKAKKLKVFDPIKMRTQGTESEKFVKKGVHLKPTPKPKKKDWRKQHEDFIATIRAAKSGNAPPPTDNSDYIDCPHCGRKFSESAADRHIPKCASIKSNKPTKGNRRR